MTSQSIYLQLDFLSNRTLIASPKSLSYQNIVLKAYDTQLLIHAAHYLTQHSMAKANYQFIA